jgi:hypothetical protein
MEMDVAWEDGVAHLREAVDAVMFRTLSAHVEEERAICASQVAEERARVAVAEGRAAVAEAASARMERSVAQTQTQRDALVEFTAARACRAQLLRTSWTAWRNSGTPRRNRVRQLQRVVGMVHRARQRRALARWRTVVASHATADAAAARVAQEMVDRLRTMEETAAVAERETYKAVEARRHLEEEGRELRAAMAQWMDLNERMAHRLHVRASHGEASSWRAEEDEGPERYRVQDGARKAPDRASEGDRGGGGVHEDGAEDGVAEIPSIASLTPSETAGPRPSLVVEEGAAPRSSRRGPSAAGRGGGETGVSV